MPPRKGPDPKITAAIEKQRERDRVRGRIRALLPPSVRWRLIEEAGARCTYCGVQGTTEPWWDSKGPDGRKWNFDHWTPITRGGALGLDNVVLSCSTCNSLKAERTGTEFLQWLLAEESTPGCHTPHRALILQNMLV